MVIDDFRRNSPKDSHKRIHVAPPSEVFGACPPIASPLNRVAAVIVDFLIVLLPLGLFLISPFKQTITKAFILGEDLPFYEGILKIVLLTLGLTIFYQSVFTAYFGGTLGKLFMGLQVRRIWSDQKPSLGMSLLRSVVWCGELLWLGLPFLSIFSNIKRRAMHDRLSDTIVVSRKEREGSVPALWEVNLVKTIYSSLFVFFLMYFSVEGIRFYHYLSSESRRAVLELDPPNFGCEEVNRRWEANSAEASSVEASSVEASSVGANSAEASSVEASSVEASTAEANSNEAIFDIEMPTGAIGPSRLSFTMSLFAAGFVEEECLEKEVGRAFAIEETPLAYLARSLVFSKDIEMSELYLGKSCELDPHSDECKMSVIIKDWGVGRRQEVKNSYATLEKSVPDYMKLWGVRQLLRMGEYESVLTLIQGLSDATYLAPFLSEFQMKSYWGLRDYSSSAAIAGTLKLHSRESFNREVSPWYCFRSLLKDCGEKESSICSDFKEYAESESQWTSLDGLAYIKLKECGGAKKTFWDSISSRLSFSGEKKLIKAGLLFSEERLPEGLKTLKSIFSDKESGFNLRQEARRRYIKWTTRASDLDFFVKEWLEVQGGMDWEIEGRDLFQRYFNEEKYEMSFKIGEVLKSIFLKYEPNFFKKSVIAAYHSGHHKEAWNMIKDMGEKASEQHSQFKGLSQRKPSSEDSFEVIMNLLIGEFEK